MRWLGGATTKGRLSILASETFFRLIETLDALMELFDGDLSGAIRWLKEPNVALANRRPVDLMLTEHGARAVRQVLKAIEFGLPA